MPLADKRVQTGTDRSGAPIYTTQTEWYKSDKRRKRRRKGRKKARRRTAAARNPLLMMGV